MKKMFVFIIGFLFFLGFSGLSPAEDNPLRANEKRFNQEIADLVPKDKIINVEQFHKIRQEVSAGTRKAYLIDVRSDTEFAAFHIEGTDHVQAGLWYTIPKKIKDPNTEIYVWCRSNHRARYVAGFLYKIGFKNVWLYNEGVIGWIKAGYPFVNACTGEFKIYHYRKHPSETEKSYRIR